MRVLTWVSTAFAVPTTMKAGALTKRPWDAKIHLENLQQVSVPVPTVKADEVLIEVAGSSVNPVDWKLIETPLALTWSYPHIFGRDLAGTVAAVGSSVSRLKVGDKVWADNSQGEGAFGEYVALKAANVGMAPTKVPLAAAAVLPLVALTGLEAMEFAKAPFPAGAVAVVLGGSGGTGHVGVQLARAMGAAKVITTCGTDHVDFCKGLGADQVIDYHKDDWHTVIPAQSVDFVYDTVALKGTGDKAYDVLKDNGAFVTLLQDGLASKETAAKRPSIRQEFFLTDSTGYERLDKLAALVDQGKLVPRVDQTFTTAQIAAAFNTSLAGHTAGKISVVPEKSVLV
mmetsp:Transcript_28285/g.67927  ORF Transcript_28285/g.67927 Transcript_28285/m.67927 type:complete len:342 (+) Transcript_28285:48-1073(+)